jgi:hypothetical protein
MDKKLSTRSARSFARSKNEVLAYAPDRISTTVPDRRLSKSRADWKSSTNRNSQVALTETIGADQSLLGA